MESVANNAKLHSRKKSFQAYKLYIVYSAVITEQANFAHAIFTSTMAYEVPLFSWRQQKYN